MAPETTDFEPELCGESVYQLLVAWQAASDRGTRGIATKRQIIAEDSGRLHLTEGSRNLSVRLPTCRDKSAPFVESRGMRTAQVHAAITAIMDKRI